MTFEDSPSTGNPAGFIKGLLAEGEGPTSGLSIYREAGGRIQDSRWFELYGQVNATLQSRPEALGLEPGSLPGPADYGQWSVYNGFGRYATQVEIQIYDRDIDSWISQQATYITDTPHTPEEAENYVIDAFDPSNTGSDFNQVVMGAVATSFWRTVPFT